MTLSATPIRFPQMTLNKPAISGVNATRSMHSTLRPLNSFSSKIWHRRGNEVQYYTFPKKNSRPLEAHDGTMTYTYNYAQEGEAQSDISSLRVKVVGTRQNERNSSNYVFTATLIGKANNEPGGQTYTPLEVSFAPNSRGIDLCYREDNSLVFLARFGSPQSSESREGRESCNIL